MSVQLTLADYAESILREKIFSEELEPGARINVDGIATELGMSSIPMREALRSLTSKGLVDALARRGYRVRAADRADLDETYSLRVILDPMAVQQAVPRLDDVALAEIRTALDELDSTMHQGDSMDYYRDHRRFHFSIYEHCGSRWLLQLIDVLWDNSHRYQKLSVGRRGSVDERVEEHRAILRACEAAEADEAARLMREHLTRTWTMVGGVLDASAQPPERSTAAGVA